jgi:hypothetical protein
MSNWNLKDCVKVSNKVSRFKIIISYDLLGSDNVFYLRIL